MPRKSKQSNPRSYGRQSRNNNRIDYTRPSNLVGGSSMQTPILGPTIRIERRVDNLFDIGTDGINPSVGVFNFSLDDLPNYTEFTRLFQYYQIEEIQACWRPEYTELTDAALVSNAVNTSLTTAISYNGVTPSTVSDVFENANASTTSITKEHRVRFKPAMLMNGLTPCYCYIISQNPSENYWGIQYAIPPTGVPMRFFSTIVFRIALRGPQ